MAYKSGLYSGLRYDVYPIESNGVIDQSMITQLDDDINLLTENYQQDSVVSIFMIPQAFVGSGGTIGETPISMPAYMTRPTTIDGYTPRNKKLLTYPYMYAGIDTLTDAKIYRYEWATSDDGMLHFAIYGAVTPNPEIVVSPVGYNGTPLGDYANPSKANINSSESVVCAGFPQCPYIIDSYRAWLAQHGVEYVLNMAGAGVMTGAFLASGNLTGAAQSHLNAMNIDNQRHLAEIKGSRVRGTVGAGSEVAKRTKAIYFKQISVTAEYAKMIDDFFDRFGYTTGRLKVPNRNARPHWTYTKTKDVNLRGNVPTDDMRKIKEIYDNGITFWNNGSEVGNYSLDNSPASS